MFDQKPFLNVLPEKQKREGERERKEQKNFGAELVTGREKRDTLRVREREREMEVCVCVCFKRVRDGVRKTYPSAQLSVTNSTILHYFR